MHLARGHQTDDKRHPLAAAGTNEVGTAPFHTNLGSRNTVAMALMTVQKMDDDLKKDWEVVLDLRLASESWGQNRIRDQKYSSHLRSRS